MPESLILSDVESSIPVTTSIPQYRAARVDETPSGMTRLDRVIVSSFAAVILSILPATGIVSAYIG